MMRKYTSIHLTDETYQTSLILYCCQMSMQAPFYYQTADFRVFIPWWYKGPRMYARAWWTIFHLVTV